MARRQRRQRRLAWFLFVAFLVVPIVEIYVLIQVGQAIGPWWTILLLIADSVLGSWLIRREGGRAWQALRVALLEGRMPSNELADGALVLLGGALLLSPGFVLDVLGVLLVLPVTRPVFRRVLARVVARRLLVMGSSTPPDSRRRPRPEPSGPVVRGDVVDD